MKDDLDRCHVCNEQVEDIRHVAVECFYAVNEVVPGIKEETMFQEVCAVGSFLGEVRSYPKGTREVIYVQKTTVSPAGTRTTHLKKKKVPIAKIRLLAKTMYSRPCCKSCRGDFLEVFGRWAKGAFISNKGIGNIPVRINGAIKMLTERQYTEYKKVMALEYTKPAKVCQSK